MGRGEEEMEVRRNALRIKQGTEQQQRYLVFKFKFPLLRLYRRDRVNFDGDKESQQVLLQQPTTETFYSVSRLMFGLNHLMGAAYHLLNSIAPAPSRYLSACCQVQLCPAPIGRTLTP